MQAHRAALRALLQDPLRPLLRLRALHDNLSLSLNNNPSPKIRIMIQLWASGWLKQVLLRQVDEHDLKVIVITMLPTLLIVSLESFFMVGMPIWQLLNLPPRKIYLRRSPQVIFALFPQEQLLFGEKEAVNPVIFP